VSEKKLKFEKLAGSPIDNQVDEPIEEAVVEDIKPELPAEEQRPAGRGLKPRRRGMRYYLPILFLSIVIGVILVALISLSSSDNLTEDSDPPLPPTKTTPNPPAKDKKDKSKSKKNNGDKKKKGKQPADVILLPSDKQKQKNKKDENASTPLPVPSPGDADINPTGDSRIVKRAVRELRTNRPPEYLRDDEKAFADYLSRRLDYPVVADTVTERSGILGAVVIGPFGQVILTSKGDSFRPVIERIQIWPEELPTR